VGGKTHRSNLLQISVFILVLRFFIMLKSCSRE